MEAKVHEGRNVKRFREMLGIKQDALAYALGEEWSQQRISLLEQRETIDPSLLKQISDAMKVPVEAFQNFDDEQIVNLISNTASFENCQQPAFFNYQPSFNPIDKMIELYERMLQQQKEMIERLEKLIKEK